MEQQAREGRGTFREVLNRVTERFARTRSMKPGHIVFRLEGTDGGSYVLECTKGECRILETAAAGIETVPLIEVIGDGARIKAILSGEKDAVQQFFAGGFRVRGDIRYLSDVALELGLIKEPL